MKSDTETAIIAFRNRVAEVCKAEVTMEDQSKVTGNQTVSSRTL